MINPAATFRYLLWGTLALKLLLAALLPLSGDEAYFVVWARHPDFGYYDHPPMVGWWLHLMLYLGNAELLLRLPAVLTGTVTGWLIYRLLHSRGQGKALLAASLFLLAPLHWLNVLITTDTPLILFASLSLAALHQALQNDARRWYLLAGALLGLAFLSKYFAVLLGAAYLAYFLFTQKSRARTLGFLLLFAAALPFVLLNVYWNYTHCWDNILFNLYTRNEGDAFAPGKPLLYLALVLYLVTPPLLRDLFRHRAALGHRLREGQFTLFAWAFFLPMAAFLLLSFKKLVGLHWVLAFYPFLFLLLPLLSREALLRALKFMAAFSALHLAVLLILAIVPPERWKDHRLYPGAVLMLEPQPVVDAIRSLEAQGYVPMADGYTPAALLSYHYGKNFAVFGEGSLHARQDDMLTDFRLLDGQDILVFSKSMPELAAYTPYFSKVEVRPLRVREATFHLVLGQDFAYPRYRETVLRGIKERYYRIPAFLPHAPCYFCDRYFPEEGC